MSLCYGCANDQPGYSCYSMLKKPRDKWCYMMKNEAMQAEKAVIEYDTKELEKPMPKGEYKQIEQRIQQARDRLKELEG